VACFCINLPVFMWRSHIPKFKFAFPSGVLFSSDYQPYRNLTFYNVLARQGSSFCNKDTFEFPSFCVAWLEDCKWVIALVFANWTILALEEIFISTCRSSRVIRVRFNSTTQRQMFLFLYGSHVCPSEGHKHGASIQSSINLGKTLLRITRERKTAET